MNETDLTQENTKCGFVALIGRPNAGKSTLLNSILGEKIAMVSQKANATRKRSNAIVMHNNAQIIFVDTPGLHEKEKVLNQYMLEEAMKAIGDCDFIVYLAPVTDSLENYEKFLKLVPANTKHIIALSKIDQVPSAKLLKRISSYNQYSDRFEALIPISASKSIGYKDLLDTITKHLEISPYLYDPDDITTQHIRAIYKEFIREAIFDNVSAEIPYESDVVIDQIDERKQMEYIKATIIVEKESQKGIIIGNQGATIKRIGQGAREKIETLSGHKSYLELFVVVKKGWTKDKKFLEEIGYI
jgi:GTPase